MIDAGAFWWENVTGPQLLVDQLAMLLGEGKTVLLQSAEKLPWREQLMDCAAQRLISASIRPIYWPQGPLAKNEAPSVLLGELAPGKASTCPVDYQAQLRFLKEQKVFAGSVVWINARETQSWTELRRFLSDYRSRDLEQEGGFVVELSMEQEIPMHLAKHIEILPCRKYVYKNDIRLFASILVSKYSRPDRAMWEYAAALSAELVGQNVELIPEFLQLMDFTKDDAKTVFLSMGADSSEKDIETQVWKAQLQAVFPMIEMERIRITGLYSDLIDQALAAEYWDPQNERSGYVTQRGELGYEEVKAPTELELGTMVRMMSLKRNEDRNQNLLVFPEPSLRSWIIALTNCRNKLAHHIVCTPGEIHNILSTYYDCNGLAGKRTDAF